MTKKQDFLPIVLGSDENAYGMARLFVEAYGVKPLLLCRFAFATVRNSRLLRLEEYEDLDRDEVFLAVMQKVLRREAEHYEKIIVLPCADYYVSLLVKYYDRLEGLICHPFIRKELLGQLDTKSRFCQLCREYGLPHPETVIVSPEERERVVETLPFGYPIIVKPDNSNATDYLNCNFEGKKKVFLLHSKEEYLAIIRAMNDSDYQGKLVIQRYIPGGVENLRVVNTYSDTDGKLRVISCGQAVLNECAPGMLGSCAAIITRYDERIMQAAKDFLEGIGYVGFADFDVKYDSETDEIYFLELNPRLGRSSFYLRAAGHNIMRTFADDVVYGKKTECIFLNQTALWRNVPVSVLRRYIKNRELRREVLHLIRKKKCLTARYCREDRSLKRLRSMLRYDSDRRHEFLLYGEEQF